MSSRPLVPTGLKLFLLFTVVPLVELLILVWLTTATSFLFTLSVVLLTGLIGAEMARREGAAVLRSAQAGMAQGRFPADSLIDGLLVLIGGILLITPGILTDLAGFSVLVPPVRGVYRRILKRWFQKRFHPTPGGMGTAGGGFRVYTSGMGSGAPRQEAPPAVDEADPGASPFRDESPFSKLKKQG